MPTLPRPPLQLDPTCVIADTAVLFGTQPITVGAHAVLHPRSRINSTYGPVTLGAGCIVSERCQVGVQHEAAAPSDPTSPGVELAANVSIEPGATIEAKYVGEGSVVEAGAVLKTGCVLGKNCRVTPRCEVSSDQYLEDFTIVYGQDQTRREKPGLELYRAATHQKQLEVLKRLIPSNLAKWHQAEA